MAATQEPVARSSSVSGAQENSVSRTWEDIIQIVDKLKINSRKIWRYVCEEYRVGGDGVVVVLGAALPAQTVVRTTRAGGLVPLKQ